MNWDFAYLVQHPWFAPYWAAPRCVVCLWMIDQRFKWCHIRDEPKPVAAFYIENGTVERIA